MIKRTCCILVLCCLGLMNARSQKFDFKIRTITAGITLKSLDDTATLKSAVVFLKSVEKGLTQKGYEVQTQLGVPLIYKDIKMEQGFRMDLLVNNKVIVEVKSVDTLLDVHHKQLLTYLKLSDKKLGLLINFNVSSLKNSITRIDNDL